MYVASGDSYIFCPMSESSSELLLSSLSEGELYCAPVFLTCNACIISV